MVTQTKKICAKCNREYPTTAEFCPVDGQTLTGPITLSDIKTEAGSPEADTPTIPPQSDPFIGRIIEKRYEIRDRIGKGGMGSVYRAHHINLNRDFAIKLINRELCADPTAMERFRREAKALGAIQHPNAVNVSDFGVTDQGEAFLVMEMLRGQVLRYTIVRESPLQLTRIAPIFKQICSAISAAHKVGVIHRDLKPENIMLIENDDGDEVAKVLDFGIAKLQSSDSTLNQLTASNVVFGTPRYMSPEACQGLEQTRSSDIYALGIILHELLTGRAPFEGKTGRSPTEIAIQHLQETPAAPSEYRADIPPEVDAVVLKALSKKPGDRFATAVEFAEEFEDAVFSSMATLAPETNRLPMDTITASGLPAIETQPVEETLPLANEPPTLPHTPSMPSVGPPTMPQVRPPVIEPPTIPPPRPPIVEKPTEPHAVPSTPSRSWVLMVAGLAFVALCAIAVAIVGVYLLNRPGNDKIAETTPWTGIAAAEPVPGMVFIPGGAFMMGETPRPGPELDREKYDGPPHTVRVAAFYIDVTEVSNADYSRFLSETRREPPPDWPSSPPSATWKALPVSNVSWEDASAYAAWAGKRLPTEDEWEYAARGADGRRYPWGDDWDGRCARASGLVTSNPDPVGSHPSCASPFGALDLAGNVWEWTASSFAPYPGGPEAPDEFRTAKITRGGAWTSTPWDQRSTHRDFKLPTTRDTRIGFRCAKSVGQ